MNPLMIVKNAHKRFKQVTALQGINLQLASGETLALLGPNGAGKSTLIRAMAGRLRLDEGQIERAKSVTLGVVPQEIAVYSTLTARENLWAFAAFHGQHGKAQRDAVDWALEWTGLAQRADEPVEGFSGGMKRRLNLACGVLHRPQIVLLDEPTVGVDPQSRVRINDMLTALREQGTALLLTTHQLDEAQTLCDRLAIIDGGKIIADGPLHQLLHKHLGQTKAVFELATAMPLPPMWTDLTATDPKVWQCDLQEIAADLATYLRRFQAADIEIADIRLVRPNLQALFLHLTGRELRD